ncbi:MAG: helix-turn-helix domain-containing protein [Kiritimatiellales bacterium]
MSTKKTATFPRIMPTDVAAVYLGISEDSLRRLLSRGLIRRQQGFKHPFRFSKIELDRYLEKGQVA